MPRLSEATSHHTSEPEPAPEPDTRPYELEVLTPVTRPIIELWGRTTMSRLTELEMNGAPEWARFLRDIFETVGAFAAQED